MNQQHLIVEQVVCPYCFHSQKPREITEEIDDKFVEIRLQCRLCRKIISKRKSTAKIEKIRRDIIRLRQRVSKGDAYLDTVLQNRIKTYIKLRRSVWK